MRADPAEAERGSADPRRWVVLGVVLTSTFLVIGGVSLMNLAIPSIQDSLHAGFAEVMFAVAGYGLVYAVFLTTGGRLGDLLGRKRVLLTGLAVFVAALTAGGLAPDAQLLIAARLVQGFGAALIYPQVLSVIDDTFTGRERTFALGLFGASIGVAIVSGQLIGGGLIELALFGQTWRPALLVLVPVGLAALLTGKLAMRDERPPGAELRIDYSGIALIATALFCLVLPLLVGPDLGWPWWSWAMLAATGPAFALLLRHERVLASDGRTPLVDPALFRQRSFSVGMLIGVIFFVTVVGFTVYTTLTLQLGMGLVPMQAGLAYAPVGVAFFLASLLAPRLVLRHGGRSVLTLGCALLAAGLAAVYLSVSSAGADTSGGTLLLPLLVVGAGQGCAMSPLIGSVLAGIRPHDRGAAAGALTTAFQLGQALGVAGVGTLFTLLGAVPGAVQQAEHYRSAYRTALVLLACLALVCLALVSLLPSASDAEHHVHWAAHGRRTGAAHALYHLTGGHVAHLLHRWTHHHDRPPEAAQALDLPEPVLDGRN
ncbi:MFS transporter [Streptacidiphilus fuscans]|uniref:MFS transporter n=1 Tax=Streptacidiphilus fuscans TaxID=2789292 RepID=A0A931FFZ1_9ACTN|nr:MFS transporter [Streptacidiphilus fuscans]MBF9070775.1 MFS transporter [Streptacidiphilus fuscans]